MDIEEYRKKIELDILKIIEQRLNNRSMNADRAKEIAKHILSMLHPNIDINQIYETVRNLGKLFPELMPVVIEVKNNQEEKMKKDINEKAEKLLNQNKISEATDLIKKYIND